MLRVFGRLPDTGVSERKEVGVRKASGEETAGEWSPAVVSVYAGCQSMGIWRRYLI